MTNVGILTCANSVQEMACSGFLCYKAAYEKSGAFADHPEEIRIKGMISCAGCPTKNGFEKILRRVNSLVASGVEVMHFGNCMVGSCPFLAKYEKTIQENHPSLKIVHGVHDSPYPPEIMAKVGERAHAVFNEPRPTAPEIIQEFSQAANP